MTTADSAPPPFEEIYALWDQLADFDAADSLSAREFFLDSLRRILGAQNATWIGAVLMDTQPADPLGGWRPRSVHRLINPPRSRRLQKKKIKAVEEGKPDIVTVRRVAGAGTFRIHRLVDIAPEGWFDEDYYHQYYLADGIRDTMWAGIPVNHDLEVYLGLYRSVDDKPFSPDDVTAFAFALKGLRWFHRQQLLGEGVGVASEPLTPAERCVLAGLLQGFSEREIAQANKQSTHTTHDHVKRIYRKYGVSSRSALMALWLGTPP